MYGFNDLARLHRECKIQSFQSSNNVYDPKNKKATFEVFWSLKWHLFWDCKMKWTKVFSRETGSLCISCWCKITPYKYRVFTVFNMYSPLFPWCILSAPMKYFKIINQSLWQKSSLFWDKKSTLRVIEQAKYTLKKKTVLQIQHGYVFQISF